VADGKVEGEDIGYAKGVHDGKDAARDEMEGRV
jgi:hypothetical protein